MQAGRELEYMYECQQAGRDRQTEGLLVFFFFLPGLAMLILSTHELFKVLFKNKKSVAYVGRQAHKIFCELFCRCAELH